MLINFLDPIFKPNLTCDKISDDLYDLTNLVSSNQSKRNLGWQAYSSIKEELNFINKQF